MLSLGSLEVVPPLVLAPMAGITDGDFRRLVRRVGGCGLVTMEFVSSEGLTRDNPRAWQMLRFSPEERPISVQIYGADPARMAAAAASVQDTGADVCDINMGCPANRVLKGCAGAALAADLDLAARVIRAVRAVLRIPLTVKLRLGLRDDRHTYLELGRICEAEGVDALTLHPRTARQQYSGQADWSHIAQLAAAVTIPVVGNGDVTTPEGVQRMLDATGCAAVMIGRASLANPWIFRQAAELLAGQPPTEPTLAERRDIIVWHFQQVLERDDERTALHRLRTFTGWYTHGLPEGRTLRRQLSSLTTAPAVLQAVEDYFATRSAA
jgi:tRNA-dihydrouridine synthase B